MCFSTLHSNPVDIRDILLDLATHQANQVILLPLEDIHRPPVQEAIHLPLPLVVIPQVQGATPQPKVQVTHQPLGQVATHHQVRLAIQQPRLAIRLERHQEATRLPRELASTRPPLGQWLIHKDSLLAMVEPHRREAPDIRHSRFQLLPCLLHQRFVRVNID